MAVGRLFVEDMASSNEIKVEIERSFSSFFYVVKNNGFYSQTPLGGIGGWSRSACGGNSER